MRPRKPLLAQRTPLKTATPKSSGILHKRLFFLACGLFIFGALMIYSASSVLAKNLGLSSFHYLAVQGVWLAAAFVFGYLAFKFNLDLLAKSNLATLIVGGSIVGLILVLFVGKNINGATRWIDLGAFDLQPSEIAKLAIIIYLAALFARRTTPEKGKDPLKSHIYEVLLPFLLVLGVICGLILLQPDLDTAVIIAITALAMYYVSGTDFMHTIGTFAVLSMGGLLAVGAAILAPYRLDRVSTWLNLMVTGDVAEKFTKGNHLWNTLIAISSGGLMGLGYGESRGKLYYLNIAAYTDSIFTVIAEEFGLIGTILVILAFIYFLYLGIGIAQNSKDKFTGLLAIGITTWISVQAFLNIGANLTVVPFGGIPLPFISYGGSNTIMIAVGVGLLLNIHARNMRGGSSPASVNNLANKASLLRG